MEVQPTGSNAVSRLVDINPKEEETLEQLLRGMLEIKQIATNGGVDWLLPKVDELYQTISSAAVFNKFLRVTS